MNQIALKHIQENLKSKETSLDLSYCQITGNESELELLQQCTHLEELDLRINKIEDISFLKNLPKLQKLDLSKNKVQDIHPLQALQNLQEFYFSDNQIKDVSSLETLHHLEKLDLRNNFIQDISFLKNTQKLQRLDLGWNTIQDISFLQDLTKLQVLYLHSNQIEDISFLRKLSGLTVLFLSKNKIQDITSLEKLTNLKRLDLRENQIQDISILQGHQNLQKLYLSSNQIQDISFSQSLPSLRVFYVGGNQLRNISFLKQLPNLQEVSLSANEIEDISSLKDFPKLRVIYLSKNRIRDIASLQHLPKLQELSISFNQIEDIASLKKLSNLEALNLSDNQILAIDLAFFNELLKLKVLYINNNPIQNIPKELFNQGNKNVFKRVKDYLQSLEAESRELNEAKLIFVGVGEVGKSELSDALSEKDYYFDVNRKTTKGIRVKPWQFQIEHEKGKPVDFTANVWDFAGQEINYGTHQFFLTKNSVYVFVWDSRKEEENSDFYYWLNIVKLLSDAAPIFVVQNKVDIYETEINQKNWKAAFPNIVDFYKTSCATGTGIEELRAVLTKEMLALPSTHEKWNLNRFEVKKTLEQDTRDFISYQEYTRLCKSHQLSKEDADFLGQQLHDIGVILNFRQDVILKDTVVLNTEWATAAAYIILNSSFVKEGKFQVADLDDIWDEARFDGQHAFLLRLMERFKLVFQLKNSDTYIIPRLLPIESLSEYEVGKTMNKRLRLSLHYDFMPKDILSQFICTVHPIIKAEFFWRYGVVLEYINDTEAEVLLNDVGAIKVISIEVWGEEADKLLAIIRQELDVIHQKLNNPSFKELIPCNCSECKESDTPFLYDYQTLLKFKKKGRTTVVCNNSAEDVSIAGLLEGILDKTPPELASLFKLIEENDMFTFFERLNEMGVSNQELAQLRQEYIHGDNNFRFPQRLKIWLMDYYEQGRLLEDMASI